MFNLNFTVWGLIAPSVFDYILPLFSQGINFIVFFEQQWLSESILIWILLLITRGRDNVSYASLRIQKKGGGGGR